jgi:NADPH-dependent 2,4-dienoyl-CoA reductase/sulfur reductase-like enzyme/rhodanese-related sulfurtransferase
MANAGEVGELASGTHSVVVVGASAAGLRCASRLARLRPEWRVTVVEARETFSYAACGMPYVLSGDITDLEALHRTSDGATRDRDYFQGVKGIEVLAGWQAVAIDSGNKGLLIRDSGEREQILPWVELVLATGARPLRLPGQPDHPRILTFHTAEDVKSLHQGLATGKIGSAIVIGAGFLGCELAEAFTSLWGAEVTLLEAAASPLPAQLDPETGAMVARILRENDVDLRLGARVDSFEASDDQVVVHVDGGESVAGDVAVVAIGVEPAVELAAAAGIALGPTGAIAVDDRLATSMPHVWAAGDVIELKHVVTGEPVWVPLGSLANRQGRTLANILAGRNDRFGPVAAASAIKVFDLNVASTGVNRLAAGAHGQNVRSVWTSAHDRADYWPEAEEISIQLTYRTGSRQVVGVQAVGAGEVAKRIDVATQLLHTGATLADFARIEHAYSPPYAPALEPLAVAAMVAENTEDGIEIRSPEGKLDGFLILDARNAEEIEARPLELPGVTCLTLEKMRAMEKDLDLRPWLVVCERGTRAAETVRWLNGRGVAAAYLGGGLRWRNQAGLDQQPDKSLE